MSTPSTGVEGVIAAIEECVDGLGSRAVGAPLGIGAPGAVDLASGVVLRAPNLAGFEGPVSLAKLLEQRLNTKVTIDNDVNVATRAEHRLGAGQGHDDLVGVFVGTGVGGGLILDGRLRRGQNGVAGEIGHMVVRQGGRRCGCGHRGHLEAYAGRAGLEAEARRRHAAGTPTRLVELAGDKRMKSRVFASALDAADPLAMELLTEATEALGAALASVMALVDVSCVVVGGGLADRLGSDFVTRVATSMTAELFVATDVVVRPAALGDLAGAIGAALLATDVSGTD